MAKVHLICRRVAGGLDGVTAVNPKDHIYRSAAWDFKINEAKKLLGGKIYFHQAKSAPSHYGGEVLSVEEVKTDNAREVRILFTFKATADGRGVPWSGSNHVMAWTSGIMD